MDQYSTVTLHTGNKMPVIGIGTSEIHGNVKFVTETAIAAGYRMIDTSHSYGTQVGIGEALKETLVPRTNMYIISKVEKDEVAYDATKQTLAELGLDYVDLMLIHNPSPDENISERLWRGLIMAWHEGMAIDIGVSNFSEEQILELMLRTGVKPTVNQIEWSPFGWSRKMDDFCRENGIVIQSYSPLTNSLRLHDSYISMIAKRYEKTPAQILLRWNLQHGWVPIPKSDNPSHMKENLDVFGFELIQSDMDALDDMNEDFSIIAEKPIYQLNRKTELFI